MNSLSDEQGSVNEEQIHPFQNSFEIWFNRRNEPVFSHTHGCGRLTAVEALRIAELAAAYAQNAPTPQEIAHETGNYCAKKECRDCESRRNEERFIEAFDPVHRPKRVEAGWVYLAQIDDLYKIGATGNIAQRIKSLRSEHKTTVTLIHAIRTSDKFKLELQWLRRFLDLRVKGEIFFLTKEHVDEFCSYVEAEVAA